MAALKRHWIVYSLLALGVILAAAVVVSKAWAMRLLAKGVQAGPNQIRFVDPRLTWALNFDADSLYVAGPTLKARTGLLRGRFHLYSLLWGRKPKIAVEADTLLVHLSPAPDTAAKKPKSKTDSIAFPDFKLPFPASLTAARITVENDSGELGTVHGLSVGSNFPRRAQLDIDSLHSPQAPGLLPGLHLEADWSGDKEVVAELLVRVRHPGGEDSVWLRARQSKANLLIGRDSLALSLRSSRAYAAVLGDKPLPLIENLRLKAGAAVGRDYALRATMDMVAKGFKQPPIRTWSPQTVHYDLHLDRKGGAWTLTSTGARQENLRFQGRMVAVRAIPDSLPPQEWLKRMGMEVQGQTRNLFVTVGAKSLPADMELRRAWVSLDSAALDLRTRDGSTIMADIRHPTGARSGTFTATLAPGERWVTAFTDTNVAWKGLALSGTLRGADVEAQAKVYGLKAYNLVADSLLAYNAVHAGAYELRPSPLYYQGRVWTLAGYSRPSGRAGARAMEFSLSNPDLGSVRYAAPAAGRMDVRIDRLALAQLPYLPLQKSTAYSPRVSGTFRWNQPGRAGAVDIRAQASYRGKKLDMRALADWDKDSLRVPGLTLDQEGSRLVATSRIALHGHQFFELAKLGPKDFSRVEVRADRFDLAQVLSVLLADPPLRSGQLVGDLAYTPAGGFSGTYRIVNFKAKPGRGLPDIPAFSLRGDGDRLSLDAVTRSAEQPFLNDTIALRVAGVLAKDQNLDLRVVTDKALVTRFQGQVLGFKSIRGDLTSQGAITIAEGSQIRALDLRAAVAGPFQDLVKSLTVQSQSLRGQYVVARTDTQAFAGAVQMRGGVLSVPDLGVRNAKGQRMDLRATYTLTAPSLLVAQVDGESFDLALGPNDRFILKDMHATVRVDSLATTAQARFSVGDLAHTSGPLKVEGQLDGLNMTYRAPKAPSTAASAPGASAGAAAANAANPALRPTLTLTGNFRNTLVRYRLANFKALQDVFKDARQKKQVQVKRVSQPMYVDIRMQSQGDSNRIDSDVFRMIFTGDVAMRGTLPYTLLTGQINAMSGELGTAKQAYKLTAFDLKWTNSPLEEGQLSLEGAKKLAKDCNPGTTDSCTIYSRLNGALADMKFSYESDCGNGAGGTENVAALVNSMRMGCYNPNFGGGQGGGDINYGEAALALLEQPLNTQLSKYVSRFTNKWIANTQVSGLQALASDTSSQAVALELDTKEFYRLRVQARSGYRPDATDLSNPWDYRLALIWRPPVAKLVQDSVWKQRLKNHVNVEASVQTAQNADPDRQIDAHDQIQKQVGLNYLYDFWKLGR